MKVRQGCYSGCNGATEASILIFDGWTLDEIKLGIYDGIKSDLKAELISEVL